LTAELVQAFGIAPAALPEMRYVAHHRAHAAAAFYLSRHPEALVVTLDGSGDRDCTTVWRGRGVELTPLHRIEIPHSLGWFYAAITELLGFQAYDGEYKVMGLAAYGRPNPNLAGRLAEVLRPGPLGFDYVLDPRFIHHGPHTYSSRFTDHLVDLLGVAPRQGARPIEAIHEELAFEAQRLLEDTVVRLVEHFQRETGLTNLCLGGGVALNIKMNSRLHKTGRFDHVDAFPIPGDSGLAIGATVASWVEESGRRPEPIDHVYLGPGWSDAEVEHQLRACGVAFAVHEDIAEAAAARLAEGKVVAWFQGRMEGGPRALGGRSILADPRAIAARDRVNGAIKFREYWRPFCPSLTAESAARFLQRADRAPFMILAFDATDEARAAVPAVVHIDGTMRAQTVDASTNPRFHRLLTAFERRSGVPVLLNTSFNVKGEAIVCTPRDALRTFFSTGIDALAIGRCLVEKPLTPLAIAPDDVLH
jgi:carbamoyltransferase